MQLTFICYRAHTLENYVSLGIGVIMHTFSDEIARFVLFLGKISWEMFECFRNIQDGDHPGGHLSHPNIGF